MPEYVLAAKEEAKQLEATANESAEQAKENVQRATKYVLGVVLFAVSLFFAGISTKLPRPGLKKAILAGMVIFLVAAVWIATFPISLGDPTPGESRPPPVEPDLPARPRVLGPRDVTPVRRERPDHRDVDRDDDDRPRPGTTGTTRSSRSR